MANTEEDGLLVWMGQVRVMMLVEQLQDRKSTKSSTVPVRWLVPWEWLHHQIPSKRRRLFAMTTVSMKLERPLMQAWHLAM